MNNKILEAEKSLFKYEFMSDITYLNEIIDDEYIEIGKSGKKFAVYKKFIEKSVTKWRLNA